MFHNMSGFDHFYIFHLNATNLTQNKNKETKKTTTKITKEINMWPKRHHLELFVQHKLKARDAVALENKIK